SIDKQSFIPSYLKDAFIEKLQNPNHLLYLLMCFKEYLSKYIKCMDNKLMIKYIGPGDSNNQSESISTDFSISPKILLYYFEVDIIDKGKTGIGFTKNLNNLNILPGWCSGSMRYYGNNGFKLDKNSHYEAYGPLYSTEDTIGCCINFV
ncbi:32964_t:CDS:2, partial [Racocetra persica]